MAIDVATGQVTKADYPPVPAPACNYPLVFLVINPWGGGLLTIGERILLTCLAEQKQSVLLSLILSSGSTRILFEETSDTFVKLSHTILEPNPLFLPLPESDELIWFSERTGWGTYLPL